jgi:hypothetical protein
MVSTTGDAMSGYVEAIEILGENFPIYVGGGGQPKNRVVDVEVYTSGNRYISFLCIVLTRFAYIFLSLQFKRHP